MCGCAEALVRAVVAFFDTVLVDYFLSWFRRRPGPDSPTSAHWDPLVPKDWLGEALPASDEEKDILDFLHRVCDFGRMDWCTMANLCVTMSFFRCLYAVVSGFAESTGSNEQLADGDDIEEELRWA